MTARSGWLASGALVALGAIVGIVLFGILRFTALPTEQRVHYHANWAIFIDGERLDLSDDRYMEDVFQCMADPSSQRPEDRVHMHENDQDIVHVHAAGVTWGHLLGNLGFAVGDDYLEVADVRHASGDEEASGESTLKFVLNGAPVRSIRNLAVRDQDRLLISFGPENLEDAIATQEVASNAGAYNTMPDPASCSGQVEETLTDRIRRAVWF